jgi:hypothetical protein
MARGSFIAFLKEKEEKASIYVQLRVLMQRKL